MRQRSQARRLPLRTKSSALKGWLPAGSFGRRLAAAVGTLGHIDSLVCLSMGMTYRHRRISQRARPREEQSGLPTSGPCAHSRVAATTQQADRAGRQQRNAPDRCAVAGARPPRTATDGTEAVVGQLLTQSRCVATNCPTRSVLAVSSRTAASSCRLSALSACRESGAGPV